MANLGSSITSTSANRITATAGGAVAIGDFVYRASDGDWEKAKADATGTLGAAGTAKGDMGVALNTAIANGPVTVVLSGLVENASGIEAGEAYCVSASTAGEFELHSALTEDTDYVCFMGVGVSTTSLHVGTINSGVVLNSA